MTERQALCRLMKHIPWKLSKDGKCSCHDDEDTEAIKIVCKLVEKTEVKTVNNVFVYQRDSSGAWDTRFGTCPSCGRIVEDTEKRTNCPYCQQHIVFPKEEK